MYKRKEGEEREITSLSCEYQLIIARFNINCVVHISAKKRIMSLRRKMSLTWPAQHKFLIAQEYFEKS